MNYRAYTCLVAVFVWFGVGGCISSRVHGPKEGPAYSEVHLNLEERKRTPDCCTAVGETIAISSGGENASRIGLAIHRKGGNIIDVMVGVSFALAVERPHSAGLGGGGFLTLSLVKPEKQIQFVDFRETAPGKASRDMYLDPEGNVVSGFSQAGALAVATPGFVAGMYEIHRKWGRLKWADVLAPAAELARNGFIVYPALGEALQRRGEDFSRIPYARQVFFRRGRPVQAGERLRQIHLAHVIDLIAREGKKPFYDGWISSQILDALRPYGGILTAADLKNYEVKFREPVRWEWQGFTFLSAPPPSAGGVVMAQMMKVLQGFDLKQERERAGDYVHLLSEVMKHAYADRSVHIGDPDFHKVPVKWLISDKRAEEIRSDLDLGEATPARKIRPGKPDPDLPGTTHVSIIDAEGNAVSCTLTINGPFGSGIVVPMTGIVLNNEMDDFSIKPGEANMYGLTGGEANAIAPNKRPVSSMTPTVVLREGKPVLAVGAAGGSRIISGVFQTILNYLVVFEGDLKKAVFAPRMHHQWLPDQLELEPGYSEANVKFLKSLNHEIKEPPYATKVSAVARGQDGKLIAVSEPRDEGGAAAK